MHRGPDAATQRSGGCGAAHRLLDHLAERAHVFDGNDDLDVERLADARIDDRDGPRPLCGAAAEEASDLVERTLCRGQPDALERSFGDLLEPFERQGEVRAALGRRERVDLVDDHGLDPAERVARGRREHQEQRLGRGDEEVRGMADERAAVAAARVTGTHADDGLGEGHVEPLGREADAGEGRAKVLLDVEREGPQGGDVEEPRAARPLRQRRGHQSIDAPEEGREGLARSRRGEDQGVLTARDRPPTLRLSRGRLRERGLEPRPHRGREARQGHPVEATALGLSSTRSTGIRRAARSRGRRRCWCRFARGGSGTSTRWGRP